MKTLQRDTSQAIVLAQYSISDTSEVSFSLCQKTEINMQYSRMVEWLCIAKDEATVFVRMDATTTIIFRSGKIWHPLEGNYRSRYMYAGIIVRTS